MRKKISRIVCIVIVLCMGFALPLRAQESGEKTMRIGFFPYPGFQEYDAQGEPCGYNVAYLEKIAEYTGWKYEYIKAGSFMEALKMLRDGEIDLVAPAQKTEERMEQYLFSDYAAGTEYGALLTTPGQDGIEYEAFDQFFGLKVGTVESFFMKDAFLGYAQKHGFEPQMTYYADTNRMMEALGRGEVSAVVISSAYVESGMKLLAKFSPVPFYYMLNKNSVGELAALNDALEQIQSENPGLEQELISTYYPHYEEIPLTLEEQEFVSQLPVLKVGYKVREPLSYLDDTGESAGILVDTARLISKNSGISFEFVPLHGGMVSYEDLKAAGVQAILGAEYTKVNMAISDMEMTKPLFSSSKVIVGKRGNSFLRDGVFQMALDTGSMTISDTIQEHYPKVEILSYNSTEEGLRAVLDGKADVLLQSQYAVKNLLQHPRYERLTIVPGEGLEENLSLAVLDYAKEENALLADKKLMSVLNKTIGQLNQEDVTDIVIRYTVAMPFQLTISDFIYRYQYAILLIGVVLVCAGIAALYAFQLHRKNVQIVRRNERQLTGITNNINGGVIVLLPDGGFKIEYANKGFWKMIGEDETTQEECYITYIKPDDMEKLNWLLTGNVPEGAEIRLESQIKRKDGTYVPVAFCGTLAKEEEKRLLYCVIVDITEQKRIQERLEEEKERYELIIEQANDIIFDINLKEKRIRWSNKYEKVFGWAAGDRTYRNLMEDFHVYSQDQGIYEQINQKLLEGKATVDREIRLVKKTGQPVWCRVFIHSVSNRRNEAVRLVGRIADIDRMVKEREQLEQRSRIDALTGFLNKEAFRVEAEEKLQSENETYGSVLMFLDIDNFKTINDTLGHQKGDEALQRTARIIRENFKDSDLLGRFGGDEFVVFSHNIPLPVFLKQVEKLRAALQQEYKSQENEKTVKATSSIGFTYYEGEDISYQELLEQADKALYCAKEGGKNRYVMYHEELVLEHYINNR